MNFINCTDMCKNFDDDKMLFGGTFIPQAESVLRPNKWGFSFIMYAFASYVSPSTDKFLHKTFTEDTSLFLNL